MVQLGALAHTQPQLCTSSWTLGRTFSDWGHFYTELPSPVTLTTALLSITIIRWYFSGFQTILWSRGVVAPPGLEISITLCKYFRLQQLISHSTTAKHTWKHQAAGQTIWNTFKMFVWFRYGYAEVLQNISLTRLPRKSSSTNLYRSLVLSVVKWYASKLTQDTKLSGQTKEAGAQPSFHLKPEPSHIPWHTINCQPPYKLNSRCVKTGFFEAG